MATNRDKTQLRVLMCCSLILRFRVFPCGKRYRISAEENEPPPPAEPPDAGVLANNTDSKSNEILDTGQRPEYLDLTPDEIRKLHRPGHVPTDRLLKFLVDGSRIPWTTAQKKEMRDKIANAI